MTQQAYFDYIIPIVAPELERLGFEYKKSKGGFIKKIKDGWVYIGFGHYIFGGLDTINIEFSIRINSVEEIASHYSHRNPKNLKDSTTYSILLSTFLTGKRDAVIRFTTKEQLDEIVQEKFLPFLKDKVPVFTERYVQLDNLLRHYTDPTEETYTEHISYYSLITPVIIAKLLNRGDFEEIVQWARAEFEALRKKNPSLMDVDLYDEFFDKLVAGLKSIDTSGNV